MVEIGTGAGVSGLWLLRGAPQAVLTTIDNEPEHLAAARQAFADAKIPPAKARFITGRAADVLPRMNESSYDIVLIDADPENVIEYVEHEKVSKLYAACHQCDATENTAAEED